MNDITWGLGYRYNGTELVFLCERFLLNVVLVWNTTTTQGGYKYLNCFVVTCTHLYAQSTSEHIVDWKGYGKSCTRNKFNHFSIIKYYDIIC